MRRNTLSRKPPRQSGGSAQDVRPSEARMPSSRQTSLMPGGLECSEGSEEIDVWRRRMQEPAPSVHRHDSTQLQELLQPKRGSAVRAVQDPRYPRVVSLERRDTNPDKDSDERPPWTKIGHHAILSSWSHGSEDQSRTRTRMPSYDISGIHAKGRESSMANWTNGAVDAVLSRSIDGSDEDAPGIPSRPPPPLPPAGSAGQPGRILEDGEGEGRRTEGKRSKLVEHLQENAELLTSLGIEGDWTARRRSGWLHGLRNGRGKGVSE